MHVDAVLVKRTKWSEVYRAYSERHFVKFDNEMRHVRKLYCTTACVCHMPSGVVLVAGEVDRCRRQSCNYF